MLNVFAGKVRKTGFFQKAGFPGNSERIFCIYYRMMVRLAAPVVTQLSGGEAYRLYGEMSCFECVTDHRHTDECFENSVRLREVVG